MWKTKGNCEIKQRTCHGLCPWFWAQGSWNPGDSSNEITKGIFCSGLWSLPPAPGTELQKPLPFPGWWEGLFSMNWFWVAPEWLLGGDWSPRRPSHGWKLGSVSHAFHCLEWGGAEMELKTIMPTWWSLHKIPTVQGWGASGLVTPWRFGETGIPAEGMKPLPYKFLPLDVHWGSLSHPL